MKARKQQPRPLAVAVMLLLGLSFVAFALSLALGSVSLPLGRAVQALVRGPVDPALVDPAERSAQAIVWNIRIPRSLAALGAGMALAVSGAAIQGLFRNPMASPDVLGISAGSSVGAVLAIAAGTTFSGPLVLPLWAFVGALGAGALVYFLATVGGGTHMLFLILGGLAVSSVLGASVSAILIFADQYAVSQFVFWTMGGLEGVNWERVQLAVPLMIALSVAMVASGSSLNILSLGEEQAHGLGMGVQRVKTLILLGASALTALSIATVGPIAFIGLMVPHSVRLISGADHRRLIPLSALAGSAFLLLTDTFARIVIAPYEIKTGIVTAMIGGPYFIGLIIRYQRSKGRGQ